MPDSVIEEAPTRESFSGALHPAGKRAKAAAAPQVAVFTGGKDKPYALGLAAALRGQGIHQEFIGSDEIDSPELHNCEQIAFLNLQGSQKRDAGLARKAARVLAYYSRIIRYAFTTRAEIFHILWNGKFEFFDRVVLTSYYRLLGRRIVLTAHNVNAGKRDSRNSWLNRLSLRFQYRLAHHIFVHTERMKRELVAEFGKSAEQVTVIPFGINNTLPNTALEPRDARAAFDLKPEHKVLLFFGNIAPYKGLEHLIPALAELVRTDPNYRLIIAGAVKNCASYWNQIQQQIDQFGVRKVVIERISFIPDDEAEVYFKAADILLLPYNDIFQSGVLFLGYSFGLPVIVTDVGSLKEDVREGETGFICRPKDPADLAKAVQRYFASDLFGNLSQHRSAIQRYANEKYSWEKVGEMTKNVYSRLLANCG